MPPGFGPHSSMGQYKVDKMLKLLKKYVCMWYSWVEQDISFQFPDSKFHGANMGPTWVLSAPGGPHVGLMNLAIWVINQPFSFTKCLFRPSSHNTNSGICSVHVVFGLDRARQIHFFYHLQFLKIMFLFLKHLHKNHALFSKGFFKSDTAYWAGSRKTRLNCRCPDDIWLLGPLLLTWINFDSSMDK